MIRNIHHINFVFEDLEAAVKRFENILGIGPFILEELVERGARTARFQLGETWLVLVSPLRPDSVPGRHLAEHGEGFFLISFGTEDIESAVSALEEGRNEDCKINLRRGVDGWSIADIPDELLGNVNAQLAELDQATER